MTLCHRSRESLPPDEWGCREEEGGGDEARMELRWGAGLRQMAYLRSVKQVDLPTKEGAFLPPLLYGSYEHAPQLEQPLAKGGRMRLSGLAGSARSLVLARLRHAAPLVVLMRDEERAGYLWC